MLQPKRIFPALAALTMALAGVCGAARAQSSAEWDQVIAAAKKEGKLTLYSGAPGRPEHREIGKLFEQKYGIPVDVLDGAGSEIQARIQSEESSGRVIGDVSHIGGTTQVLMQGFGQLAPHGDLPNEKKLVIEPKVPEEVPIFVNSYGILVNTNMIKPEDEPKSWLDLLDPKWKGKILAYPGWFSGSGLTWFGVMQDAFGIEYHEKMAKQDPVWGQAVRENPPSRRARRISDLRPIHDHRHRPTRRPSGQGDRAERGRGLHAVLGGHHQGRAAPECGPADAELLPRAGGAAGLRQERLRHVGQRARRPRCRTSGSGASTPSCSAGRSWRARRSGCTSPRRSTRASSARSSLRRGRDPHAKGPPLQGGPCPIRGTLGRRPGSGPAQTSGRLTWSPASSQSGCLRRSSPGPC